MAQTILIKLKDNLELLLILHKELKQVLISELNQIGVINGHELLMVQSTKIKLKDKISATEKNRLMLIEDLALIWQMEVKDLSLKFIISKSKTDVANVFTDLYKNLKTEIEAIKNIATKIGQLSATRLKPIEQTLSFLSKLQKERKNLQRYWGNKFQWQ